MGAILGIILLLASIFFVAAEYAVVSARRAKVESLAKRGNKSAKELLKVLDNLGPPVAACQIGITMIGIGMGSVVEPSITEAIADLIGKRVNHGFSMAISLLLVTFVLVSFGELFPKYLALRRAEPLALLLYRPLRFFSTIFFPLSWLMQRTSAVLLRPFGIKMDEDHQQAIPREELVVMVQSGSEEGSIDKAHAEFVTRALKLDSLTARDIMVHRFDVKWLDINLTEAEVFSKVKVLPFTRLLVCRGDIDDLVGVVYLHDIVKNMGREGFSLESILRPAVFVPESLTLERIVGTMRSEKSQLLVVADEYGGTAGILTLEDVVEEVFGELEDRLESDRPTIEVFPGGRISARADVRIDEIISRLRLPLDDDNTDTLAQTIIDALERVPRPGDSVDTPYGKMRVENMARRRITRVSLQLASGLLSDDGDGE
ncbi:MAG: HlyC/CorC family transporter [Armatimonadetes bacterium]|nr:HlyC/CorC family transporter [Armatimonadota bacterium]